MTLNKETSNEGLGNQLSFSVLLCIRVYQFRNTDTDLYWCLKVRKRFSYILPANESLSRSKTSS